jgi:hypothetical protein
VRADRSGAFFPEKGGSTREAKRICLGCEVKDACLEYALPTTSASASGAVCPSGSAVASSAASSSREITSVSPQSVGSITGGSTPR